MAAESGGPGLAEATAAFEATALPHLDTVYDAALRLTGRVAAAEDLTQETFLRAFRAFSSFTPGSNCRAWLLRIQYNLFCTDYRRARQLRTVGIDGAEGQASLELPAGEPGPEEQAVGRLEREAVHRAIDQLPEDFRTAVLLVDIHGLSCMEAARVMGTPKGTVLSRLHRARRRLEGLLPAELGWVDADD